jgi:hypothetical protein
VEVSSEDDQLVEDDGASPQQRRRRAFEDEEEEEERRGRGQYSRSKFHFVPLFSLYLHRALDNDDASFADQDEFTFTMRNTRDHGMFISMT